MECTAREAPFDWLESGRRLGDGICRATARAGSAKLTGAPLCDWHHHAASAALMRDGLGEHAARQALWIRVCQVLARSRDGDTIADALVGAEASRALTRGKLGAYRSRPKAYRALRGGRRAAGHRAATRARACLSREAAEIVELFAGWHEAAA